MASAEGLGGSNYCIAEVFDKALAKEFAQEIKDAEKDKGKLHNETIANDELDHGVDRIIDSHDNEFVLSAPKDNVATLTLDPLLVQDLTLLFASAAVVGMVFESLQQPVINGYLVAGAIVGPGGLQLIKELVQVESLAQLGVQLLLFNLGRELSLKKLKSVWSVALLGGSLQIVALMMLGGLVAAVVKSSMSQGVFVGALLSMSSTSVVVKCLEAYRTTGSAFGQITIGTLILQLGLSEELGAFIAGVMMSVAERKLAAAGVLRSIAHGEVMFAAGRLTRPHDSGESSPVLLKPPTTGSKEAYYHRLASATVELLKPKRHLVASSHSNAGGGGGLSFSSTAPLQSAAADNGNDQGLEQLGADGDRLSLGGRDLPGPGSMTSPTAAHTLVSDVDPCGSHGPATSMCANIDSIQNVLTALFVASMGLIMSPVFLMHHAAVLLLGTVVVTLVKAAVVTGVVRMFGIPFKLSLAVGLSMAHVGEFSFVLLSMANQLQLLSSQVYMLLLGITAMSLLTTPFVILGSIHLLIREGQHQLYISGPRYHLSSSSGDRSNGGSANGTDDPSSQDSPDWDLPSHNHGGGGGSSAALLANVHRSIREQKDSSRSAVAAGRAGR
eukprot:gene9774-9931_t